MSDYQDYDYNAPAPKRPRIEAKKFVRLLDGNVEFNRKFNLLTSKASFLIEELPANPESLLSAIFNYCVDQAISESERNGITPDRLGATISSRLLNPDIWIPVRTITANTVDAILNRFLEVAQSKTSEGSLVGEPFTINVTTIDRASLTHQRQIRGRGRTRTPKNVIHQVRKQHLLLVQNQDAYCLFYALELTRIHQTKEMDSRNFSNLLNRQFGQQRKIVMNLLQENEIPLNLFEYDAAVFVPVVVHYWNMVYKQRGHKFKVFIFGTMGHYKPEFAYGNDDFNVTICLFYNRELRHFDGIRCGVGTAIFGRDCYCFACECPYDDADTHRSACTARCWECGRIGIGRPCKEEGGGFTRHCNLCGKNFINEECYHHHVKSNYCARSKRCEKCGVVWNVKNNTQNGRKGHVCDEKYCQICRAYHNPKRGCYIQPMKNKKIKPYRLVAYDCETTQDKQVGPDGKRIHKVNFISAIVCCTQCMADGSWRQSIKYGGTLCRICGPHRTVTFNHRQFDNTKVDYQHVCPNPMEEFIHWLMMKFESRFPTVVFSHYGGKFDNILAYRECFINGIIPQMITKGNKIYEMKIPQTKQNPELMFRDSWNLMPVPLGALINAFGLNDIQEKEFFPHLANRMENYDRILPALPPKSDYLYGGMLPAKQRKFDAWYDEHRDEPFDLNEMLAAYCCNDTQILIAALVAFREEFLEVTDPQKEEEEEEEMDAAVAHDHNNYYYCKKRTAELQDHDYCGSGRQHRGIDITWDPLTIAKASMLHFKLNHLKPQQLALVPERGYDTCDNQSSLALKYLQWYEQKHDVEIRSAHSDGGEYRIGRYSVDGYIAATDTVIEVNGCHWHCHEHPRHPPLDPELVMSNGKTVAKIREDDALRLAFIKSQVREVKVVWECEIERMKQQEREMANAFERYHDKGPIRLRDCYHGGRTGPFRLHYQVPKGWKMKLFDVRSLYPYINAITKYPLGHPSRVNVIGREDSEVNWTRPEDVPVKGILKVFVTAPSRIDVPVLPCKFDNDQRLLFSLCRKCALKYPRGDVDHTYRCQHMEEERGWTATVTSIELAEALANGYHCTRYYRSLQWDDDQWDDQIFRGYISEFMAMKTHASGFPEELKTTEEEDEFIQECEQRFGIMIKREKMEHNKAKRTIAKLCNNSLWGRFSLRNGLTKTYVTDSPAVLRQFLDDQKIEVNAIEQLTEECVLIKYTPLEDFVEENDCSNIMISLWTTSAARIHLLRLLQKVARAPNAVLLYCDTDSVCFAYKESDGCPLETGPHLGDLTDEWPDHELIEFVSGGCKQYALRMINKTTGEESNILKIRGITLNGDVCKKLHFDTFKRSVLRYASGMEERDDEKEYDEGILIDYPNFLKPSLLDGTVHSVKLSKCYRPIVTKAIVGPDYQLVDFGTMH